MTILENAFALARSGQHRSVSDIAKALKSSGHPVGFIEDHLSGKQIRAELARICREASEPKPQAPSQAPIDMGA